MELQNSVILVTGGSLGIGKAIAKLLVENGSTVIITGRDGNRLELAAKETGAIPIVASADNEKDIEKLFSVIDERWGRLDAVINNAGVAGKFSTLEQVETSDFNEVFSVNVVGAALTAKLAAERMKQQEQGGTIINIGSTAGSKGFERGTVYAASKFALRGMTQCWQAELRKFNIRVIYLAPSEVPTAFGQDSRDERPEHPHKLHATDIAFAVKSVLEMDDRGFIPELSVWATNPWKES